MSHITHHWIFTWAGNCQKKRFISIFGRHKVGEYLEKILLGKNGKIALNLLLVREVVERTIARDAIASKISHLVQCEQT